jgi:hypothetical protein
MDALFGEFYQNLNVFSGINNRFDSGEKLGEES